MPADVVVAAYRERRAERECVFYAMSMRGAERQMPEQSGGTEAGGVAVAHSTWLPLC